MSRGNADKRKSYRVEIITSVAAVVVGLTIQENGTTVLLLQIFGAFICGIRPFIAMHILIKNSNKICNAYNRVHL